MLKMQAYSLFMDWDYNCYQYIFSGLALWHLRFNFLKMIWELFYPRSFATKRSTFQLAANHWHRDKIIRPNDFHLLQDLTIYSYWVRVIAILKVQIQVQKPSLKLHINKLLGKRYSEMLLVKQAQAMEWFDHQMEEKLTNLEEHQNDHWNNHVDFCYIVKPYMSLCYTI